MKGGKILGKYPRNLFEVMKAHGRRPVPTTPWDAVWNGVAEWVGSNDLSKVCTHKDSFDEGDMFYAENMFRASGSTTQPSKGPTDAPVTQPPSQSPVTASPTHEPTSPPTDNPTDAPVTNPTDSPVTQPPSPEPTAAVMTSKHSGADGCPARGTDHLEVCMDDTEVLSVNCCSGSLESTLSCSRPGCVKMTFAEAVAHCESASMRLCTVAELNSDACCLKGCQFDK